LRMVYISVWEEFALAAEELYTKQPVKTRYCVKWKSSEGVLVLKITDDTTCLKFKTYSSIILNRFEALNLSLMRKMQNRKPPSPISVPQPAPSAATNTSLASIPVAPTTVSQVVAAAGAPAAAGVKKKKAKKKK